MCHLCVCVYVVVGVCLGDCKGDVSYVYSVVTNKKMEVGCVC